MVKAKTGNEFYYLGNLLLEKQKYFPAQKAYLTALKKDYQNAKLFNNLGIVQKRLGKIESAKKSFTKAIKLDPELYGAHNNLGNINMVQNALEAARKNYLAANKINPYFKDSYNNLGIYWQASGDLNKAEKSYRQALEISPKYVDALNNLGSIYQYRGLTQKAIEIYKEALIVKSDSAEIYFNLASSYGTDHISKSIAMAEKAVALSPDYQDAYYLLIRQLQVICEWQKVDRLLPKLKKMTARAIKKGDRPGEEVFFTIGNWDNPKHSLQVARAWDKYITAKVRPILKKFDFAKHQSGPKIRIGYISSDFRDHVIAHLMVDIYKLHDRRKFDVYAYALSPSDGSYYRKTIQTNSVFREIYNLSYTDAAKQIYKDKIDILVDLNGYTKGARLEILALRPAPVQMTYLGFPGTTGSSFLDYTLVDKTLVPKSLAKYYSEELIYMPDCYQVQGYSRFKNIGIPPTHKGFIFCSFNNNYKIRQPVFATWMRILKQVPGSILWLLGERPESTQNLIGYAKKCGLDSKRIVFAKRMSLGKHLKRLTSADLALDTYPYNGGATTSNALFAGVPVVTLQGKNYAARMSSSLIAAAGIPEMITTNLKDYENLAVELALNKDKLGRIKAKLWEGRTTRPLFNTEIFVRNLEKAYLNIWKKHLN